MHGTCDILYTVTITNKQTIHDARYMYLNKSTTGCAALTRLLCLFILN